ncbi:hypothetical protein IZU26_02095 [Treponema sp. SP13]
MILPNIKIGDNVMIGASTVVSKDWEAGWFYASVPTKRIETFEDLVKRRKKQIYKDVSSI